MIVLRGCWWLRDTFGCLWTRRISFGIRAIDPPDNLRSRDAKGTIISTTHKQVVHVTNLSIARGAAGAEGSAVAPLAAEGPCRDSEGFAGRVGAGTCPLEVDGRVVEEGCESHVNMEGLWVALMSLTLVGTEGLAGRPLVLVETAASAGCAGAGVGAGDASALAGCGLSASSEGLGSSGAQRSLRAINLL